MLDADKGPTSEEIVDEGDELHRRRATRKKGAKGLTIFVTAWILLLLCTAGFFLYLRSQDETEVDPVQLGIGSEDEQMLQREINACFDKVVRFLEAGSPEGRAEFVMQPMEILPRMGRYQQGAFLSDSETEPELLVANTITTPAGKGIETVWALDGARKFEAVFFADEQGEWRMDWSNLVRYSEKDWALFLVGDGPDEAEFRLLARRKSKEAEAAEGLSSIALIGPRPGYPREFGSSSPEIVFDPTSRMGRVIAAAFALRDEGEGIYGSEAAQFDPPGMIRLRVRVVREKNEETEEWSFIIREIEACHWYDLDGLGLE